jgi:hypothetical protein
MDLGFILQQETGSIRPNAWARTKGGIDTCKNDVKTRAQKCLHARVKSTSFNQRMIWSPFPNPTSSTLRETQHVFSIAISMITTSSMSCALFYLSLELKRAASASCRARALRFRVCSGSCVVVDVSFVERRHMKDSPSSTHTPFLCPRLVSYLTGLLIIRSCVFPKTLLVLIGIYFRGTNQASIILLAHQVDPCVPTNGERKQRWLNVNISGGFVPPPLP